MTGAEAPARTSTDARLAWTIGGGLLIACVIVTPALQYALMGAGLAIALFDAVCFAAALLLFAFGIRGSGSVTAKRPLGTGALAALAGWQLVWTILDATVVTSLASGIDASAIAEAEGTIALLQGLSAAEQLGGLALAVIASVQILRAGVVPPPWHRAPLVVVVVLGALGILGQLLGASGGLASLPEAASWLLGLESLAGMGGAVVLGVLAIMLGDRLVQPRPAPVLAPAGDQADGAGDAPTP